MKLNTQFKLTLILAMISLSLISHAADVKAKYAAEELKTKLIYSYNEEIPLEQFKNSLAYAPYMQPFDINDAKVYHLRQSATAISFVEYQRSAKKSILHTSKDDIRQLVVTEPNICVRKMDQSIICNGETVSSDLFGQCKVRGFYVQARKVDAYSNKFVREAVVSCDAQGVAIFETGNVDIETGLKKFVRENKEVIADSNTTVEPQQPEVKKVEEAPKGTPAPLKVTAIENKSIKTAKETF